MFTLESPPSSFSQLISLNVGCISCPLQSVRETLKLLSRACSSVFSPLKPFKFDSQARSYVDNALFTTLNFKPIYVEKQELLSLVFFYFHCSTFLHNVGYVSIATVTIQHCGDRAKRRRRLWLRERGEPIENVMAPSVEVSLYVFRPHARTQPAISSSSLLFSLLH